MEYYSSLKAGEAFGICNYVEEGIILNEKSQIKKNHLKFLF